MGNIERLNPLSGSHTFPNGTFIRWKKINDVSSDISYFDENDNLIMRICDATEEKVRKALIMDAILKFNGDENSGCSFFGHVSEVKWAPGAVETVESPFVDEPKNWQNVAGCNHIDGESCIALWQLVAPTIDDMWVCNTHECNTCRLSAGNPARAAYIEEVKARVTAEKMETK